MATVPLSGSNIRFLSGVPFSNDYKHTRWFDTITEQATYFDNKPIVHSMSEAIFQRIEGKHFISVNKGIDSLWGTNYIMFQNAQYNGKWFYAFVTHLERKSAMTTYVHFEIDVLQTWRFAFNFKPSYVVREHCPLWNSDGSPVVNTVDEGLNYGQEYVTKQVSQVIPFDNVFFLVIACKKRMDVNGDKITPVLNGGIQPLTYYIHPFKMDGSIPSVSVDGMGQTLSSVKDVLTALYTSTDAVNNVVSLYITEHMGNNSLSFSMSEFEPVNIQNVDSGTNFVTLYVKNLPNYKLLSKNLGSKYDGFTTPTESKLLMYPYTVTLLTDLKGNVQEIKNEYIQTNDLELTIKGSMGVSNKVSYNVKNYLLDDATISNGEVNLLHAIINNSSNDVPIITDLLSAYIQGNRNSLENQKNSLMFNGYMNILGGVNSGVSSAMSRNLTGVAGAGLDIMQGTGNTILQIQGMQAKQKDIGNVPPSIAKMGGNTAFDYGNNVKGIYVIKKEITPEYRKKLTDFFHMYGYKMNEVKYPNFHTRQHFNYVQTQNCNIIADFNHADLQELKNVFDNGITLWHTDDVGNYTLDNGVIA
jgi:hypothetical protein